MYDLIGSNGHPASTQPLCLAGRDGSHCDVLNDEAARGRFFAWARQRNINELYVSVNPLGNNATQLADFVRASDAVGIDIQFCAGQALNAAEIAQYTRRCDRRLINRCPHAVVPPESSVEFFFIGSCADWCQKHPGLCDGGL